MGSAILGLAIVYAVQTLLLVASQPCQVGPGGPQLWGYDVVTELPHDARAYTQGLQHDVICDAQNSCSRQLDAAASPAPPQSLQCTNSTSDA
jgi:glutamine cyclotransferase